MSPLRTVIKLLTPTEKRRLAAHLGAFCLIALLGLGSIKPFISAAAELGSTESTEGFLLFLGGVLLVPVATEGERVPMQRGG